MILLKRSKETIAIRRSKSWLKSIIYLSEKGDVNSVFLKGWQHAMRSAAFTTPAGNGSMTYCSTNELQPRPL